MSRPNCLSACRLSARGSRLDAPRTPRAIKLGCQFSKLAACPFVDARRWGLSVIGFSCARRSPFRLSRESSFIKLIPSQVCTKVRPVHDPTGNLTRRTAFGQPNRHFWIDARIGDALPFLRMRIQRLEETNNGRDEEQENAIRRTSQPLENVKGLSTDGEHKDA